MYLTYILQDVGAESVIIFCATCHGTLKTALMLRSLGFSAIPIHSKMSQTKRLGAISKFKTKSRTILVGTDVVSRGLDIPDVDYVINFDLPFKSKDYIHRVGRTARAGKAGTSITFVTQYEIETFQRLEHVLGTKLDVYPIEEHDVLALKETVTEAEREAKDEMKRILDEQKESKKGKKRKGNGKADDKEVNLGIRKKIGKFKHKSKNKFVL